MRLSSVVAVLVVLFAMPSAPAAKTCADCHPEQASAWQGSRHARSAASPLYLAMRAWAADDAGEEVAARCATCHTVPVAGGGRTAAVTCEACHQAAVTGPGPGAVTVDPAGPVAGSKPGAGAPHPVAVVPGMASGDRCLACHGELANPHGVPLCTTGPEAATRGLGPTCLDCHLRGGDHSARGASPELLARAVELDVDRRGDTVAVTLVNRGAGHSVPTGPALRQVILHTRLVGADGREASSHREVLARVLADADGRSPAPPWRATAVVADTRIEPSGRSVFVYPVPPGAVRVEARIVFWRAPEPLLGRFGLAGDEAFAPVTMTRVVRDLR